MVSNSISGSLAVSLMVSLAVLLALSLVYLHLAESFSVSGGSFGCVSAVL